MGVGRTTSSRAGGSWYGSLPNRWVRTRTFDYLHDPERSVPVFRVTSRLLVCYRYPCSTVRSLNLWFSLWSDGLGERCAIHPPHPSHPSPVRRRLASASDERGPFSIRGGAAASMGGEPLPFEPGRFGGVGVGWGDGEIRVEV